MSELLLVAVDFTAEGATKPSSRPCARPASACSASIPWIRPSSTGSTRPGPISSPLMRSTISCSGVSSTTATSAGRVRNAKGHSVKDIKVLPLLPERTPPGGAPRRPPRLLRGRRIGCRAIARLGRARTGGGRSAILRAALADDPGQPEHAPARAPLPAHDRRGRSGRHPRRGARGHQSPHGAARREFAPPRSAGAFGRVAPGARDFGNLVVNVGDMLQEATGGWLPSTTHRVVNPPGGAEEGARMSLPCSYTRGRERPVERYTADAYLHERLEEMGVA